MLGLLALHGPLGFEDADRDLVAFFRGAEAARAAADALRARKVKHTLTTDIAEGDPLEAYRAASQPFAVGRRLWMEPGEPPGAAAPPGRIALRVPASRAFGTGSHASTRLALLALEDEALEGRTVLDVGTGSGILALAAAALGGASRRGRVLLSGVTRDREPSVLAKMRTGRWKLDGRRTEGEWISLCLAHA